MRRRLLVVGIVLLLVLIGGGVVLLTRDTAGERSASWLLREEPSSTRSELQVLVLVGDSCNEYRRIEVDESDTEVRLDAIVHNSGAADCASVLRTREVTVELAEPLGERNLTGCKNEHVEFCAEAPSSG